MSLINLALAFQIFKGTHDHYGSQIPLEKDNFANFAKLEQ